MTALFGDDIRRQRQIQPAIRAESLEDGLTPLGHLQPTMQGVHHQAFSGQGIDQVADVDTVHEGDRIPTRHAGPGTHLHRRSALANLAEHIRRIRRRHARHAIEHPFGYLQPDGSRRRRRDHCRRAA